MCGGRHELKVICKNNILIKFFAPIGGQCPGKADVEPVFVKRLKQLGASQIEQG
jgi:hypothetical protein